MTGTGEFRRLAERVVHQGYVWNVVVAEFEAPDGEPFTRDIVRSPGAVSALPIIGDGPDPEVVLVEQYRAPLERTVLEAPAGMRDVPGEPPEATAIRELVEETGLRPGRLVPLGSFLPSCGMTDSQTFLFAAYDLTEVGASVHGPEETHMRTVRMPLSAAVAGVVDGTITDAKTVITLLRVERMIAGSGSH